jgi:hypothetical protein
MPTSPTATTFKQIRSVYDLDAEERAALVAVVQATDDTLVACAARLDAVRALRAGMPRLPNRALDNAPVPLAAR